MLRDINVYLKQVQPVMRPNSIKPVSFGIIAPRVSFLKKPTSPRSELSIRRDHHFSALDTISLTNPQLSEQPTYESNSERPGKKQDTIYATTESFEFYRDLSHLYR
ncbi:unnamed protein product [Arabidopsis thaliana]|uniref:Uncharacterized protein n=1 Tax=Arabidopsis thaliana TaxID=3702 RepID=A0A5S9XU88_ARATH|nr:unnamed protein product [Arabidopsis thaliana]